MLVTDQLTGRLIPRTNAIKVIFDVIEDGGIIWGYTQKTSNLGDNFVLCSTFDNGNVFVFKNNLKNITYYDGRSGLYRVKAHCSEEYDILYNENVHGKGGFPYSFPRNYEAVDNLKLFFGKQKILYHNKALPISKVFKYTFGLEFETAQGFIPEDICFRDGLIPLRDGSISGLEYSTVILSGSKGFALLRQQLNTLRKYTEFDKECSLHIHLGGFPLEQDKIFALYKLCAMLDFYKYVPNYTFNTARYKASKKDYCKQLPVFTSFEQLYFYLSGELLKFDGSFTKDHPLDKERERKWNIPYRYYCVNFINLLFFNINKTVEFRFLRPSYNFEKIQLWMYLFNAILMYAETYTNEVLNPDFQGIELVNLIHDIYDPDLANLLEHKLIFLEVIKQNQSNLGDYIGARIDIDDKYFGVNKVL